MPDTNLVADLINEDPIFAVESADAAILMNKEEFYQKMQLKLSEAHFNKGCFERHLEESLKRVKKYELEIACLEGKISLLNEIIEEEYGEDDESDENSDSNICE
jgi:hypothetical protein